VDAHKPLTTYAREMGGAIGPLIVRCDPRLEVLPHSCVTDTPGLLTVVYLLPKTLRQTFFELNPVVGRKG
jgi:hypothetical protein